MPPRPLAVSIPLPPPSGLQALPAVLSQLIFQCLDVCSKLRLARCSRGLRHAANTSVAWKRALLVVHQQQLNCIGALSASAPLRFALLHLKCGPSTRCRDLLKFFGDHDLSRLHTFEPGKSSFSHPEWMRLLKAPEFVSVRALIAQDPLSVQHLTLVSQLCCLRELHLLGPGSDVPLVLSVLADSHIEHLVLHHAQCVSSENLAPMHSLRSLHVHASKRQWLFADLARICGLVPNIETLGLHGFALLKGQQDSGAAEDWAVPVRQALGSLDRLTCLTLDHVFGVTRLLPLLPCIRGLHTLQLDYPDDFPSQDDLTALRAASPTLQIIVRGETVRGD